MNFCLIDIRWIIALVVVASATQGVSAVERVVFTQQDQRREVVGEKLVEAADGGLLLQANDGQIWTIQPEEIKSHDSDERPLEILTPDDAVAPLLEQLGAGFEIHRTAHYVVVSNADPAFVQYCSMLFEKLYKGFFAFWKNNAMELVEPRFPLVAVVFDDKSSFLEYARPEAGDAAASIIGYYNLQTNRMNTYDIAEGRGARAGIFVADRNIATIIHEATHQLAYNTGLQKRFADNPYWVSEGMAIFFESPNLRRADGWRQIGRVNEVNKLRFAQYLASRPADSLQTLVQDDTRFKDSATASSAYAEAWALTYFLVKTKPKQYVAYLRKLGSKNYLDKLSPRNRLEMFVEEFGELGKLDRQFITYLRRFVLRR